MSARLYAILAREAPTGVVFRRGPSRQVQLIRWNLKDDILEMSIRGIHQTNGPWYALRYRVLDQSLSEVIDLGSLDWADWCLGRDLVFAREGCLYRQPVSKRQPGTARLIADLNPNKFEAIAAPAWALKL